MSGSVNVTVDSENLQAGATRFVRFGAYWVSLLSVTAGAFVFAVLAALTESKHRIAEIAAGALCAVAALVLPAWRNWRLGRTSSARVEAAEARVRAAESAAADAERVAADAREVALELQTKFNTSVGDIIAPIAQLLAELTTAGGSHDRARLQGDVIQKILGAATQLTGGTGVRANLYRLASGKNGGVGDLRIASSVGRADQPRREFPRRRGTARDRAVHDMIDAGNYDFQEDVQAMSDSSLFRGRQYRSYISITIKAGDRPLGMVTVDAPEPQRFDRTHVGILLALAGLLGIALGTVLAAPGVRLPLVGGEVIEEDGL